jgi:hypothetical protein
MYCLCQNSGELHLALSEDFVASKHGDSQKLDLGKWLQWQQTLQAAVLVEHTADSRMLSELLQYAENKRCQVQLTQATGDSCNMLKESWGPVWPCVSLTGFSSTHSYPCT